MALIRINEQENKVYYKFEITKVSKARQNKAKNFKNGS